MSELLGVPVAAELAQLLRTRPPTSATSVPAMIRDLGGPAAIARRVHRISGRLPARGTDARRRYDATIRRYQRAAAGGHFADVADLERLRRWHRQVSRSPRSRIRADGLLARILVTIDYSPANALGQHGDREIPKGGPGVHLAASDCRQMLRAYDDEDLDALGEIFFDSFSDGYGWELPIDAIDEAVWVKLWHVDEPEP